MRPWAWKVVAARRCMWLSVLVFIFCRFFSPSPSLLGTKGVRTPGRAPPASPTELEEARRAGGMWASLRLGKQTSKEELFPY